MLRCYEAFENKGFDRYRKRDVDKPLNADFSCWVGLNTGLYSDHFTINPFVGVHAPHLDRMIDNLEDGKYDRSVATYAVHMGELKEAEDERAFAFTPSQSEAFLGSEIDRLTNLYLEIGIKYASSIATYPILLPLLREREDMLGGYPQRVACCLYLMNETAKAKTYAERKLIEEPDHLGSFFTLFLELLEKEVE